MQTSPWAQSTFCEHGWPDVWRGDGTQMPEAQLNPVRQLAGLWQVSKHAPLLVPGNCRQVAPVPHEVDGADTSQLSPVQ